MEQIEKIMRSLGCSREDAEDVLRCDAEIDKGGRLFELDPDQKKAEKKMRSVGIKTVNPYGKQTTRERPPDTDKRFLINLITETLENITDNGTVEITNPEREMMFSYGNRKFKIVLSAPRN